MPECMRPPWKVYENSVPPRPVQQQSTHARARGAQTARGSERARARERERETERERDRETERDRERQRETERDRERDRESELLAVGHPLLLLACYLVQAPMPHAPKAS